MKYWKVLLNCCNGEISYVVSETKPDVDENEGQYVEEISKEEYDSMRKVSEEIRKAAIATQSFPDYGENPVLNK